MTKSETLRYIEDSLQANGFLEAKFEARLLLEYIAGINRNELFLRGDETIEEEVLNKLNAALSKRLKHIPIQQITGYQNFMGLEFHVDENVLIPRQDTETLVEEILKLGSAGLDILDMCTGSGCILLSILNYLNGCNGLGVDISDKALEVARLNSKELGIDAEFIQSDLFEAIDKNRRFDIIVSNPPYIRSDVIPTLMEEVRVHEPIIALDGMDDGLYFYRRIIDEARTFLSRNGMLFFEIGYDQGEDVSRLMIEAGYKDVSVVKDLSGNDRVVSGIFGGIK